MFVVATTPAARLPDLVREHSQAGTVIGFVAGVAVMLLLGLRCLDANPRDWAHADAG